MTRYTFTRILVVMPNVISDAVMSQTFLILLKQLNEKSSIDAFIESSCMVPMLKCMKELDNIYSPSQKKGWSGFLQYWLYANDLKRNCYEAAYILQTSWKSALIPYLANIPIRIGYLGNFRYGLLNVIHHESNYQSPMGKMATYARLAYQPKSPEPNQIPIPRFRYNVNPNEEQIKKFWLDEYAQTIIFCPHSLILHNCWQAEHFIELAKLIKQSFPYIQMLCIGDNKGYNTSLKIVASLTNILNLCGKIDMQQTLTLLARSSVVISNYSELMHLSTALRCKVIALYRSINIQHFPLSKKLIPIIMRNLNYESQDEEIPSPIEVFNLTRKVLKNRIHLRANIK